VSSGASRGEPRARDLDVAVITSQGSAFDAVGFATEFIE
jgi:hypothetical protein